MALKEQNQIALRYRLQICGVRAALARRAFLEKLVETNRFMIPLQNVVYASRGAKLLPGVGIAANLSEASALASLRALAALQKTLILSEAAKESLLFHCKATAFSSELALCHWRLPSSKDFYPRPTLFPDIPPTTYANPQIIRTAFACRGSLRSRLYLEKIALGGDPSLLQKDFSYVYQAREI